MSENYLLLHHKKNVIEIMQDKDTTKHFSININFVELFEYDSTLGNAILKEPEKTLEEWNEAARKVQTVLQPNHEEDYTIKTEVTCRVYGLPVYPEYHRTVLPSKDDVNKFLQVSGTVVRMASTKMLEYQRHYVCVKCKYPTVIKAQYDKKYVITPPKNCTNPELCKSTNLITVGELDSDNCKNFQEIKIQELLSIGTIPHSMWVTLEDDLVDVCKPGDSIIVCGIVKQRWDGVFVGKKINVALAIKANHIVVNNENASRAAVTSEIKLMFETFWSRHCEEPLIGRDLILKSFCPQIFGMHMVKLAMAVVLAGGSQLVNEDFSTGVRMRSESHLLLVGDPGTGKSQLLRFASKIIPRSVLTTGIGSTAAGLTVTAVMENGEWQLEAGALVLADGGICCIDEFNSMKERDRTSIHEAMEQQTISVAKASIVCTLNTRCSILAACNPKGNIDINQSLSMCTTLASPLLSRFDVILLLKDNVRNDWENLVTDYILNENHNYSSLINSDIWNVEILQAYYATIKKLNPTLTEDAKEILSRYYQMQRQTNLRNKARTTVRLLHSLIRLSQGHARLMFHNEVKVIDAVYALILVDASMDSDCALLNLNLNAHSTFPDNSTIAYQNMLEVVLNRLKLPEILQKEMDTYGTGVKSTTVKSRFFNGEPEAINPGSTCKDSFPQNNEDSTVRKNQQSCAIVPGVIEETLMDSNKSASAKSEVELEHSVQVNESKRKKLQTNNDVTTSKPKKTKRKDSDVRLEKPGKKFKKKQPLNNMEMLNLFPSINDDIFNMDLNADYSIHLDLDSSFQEDIVISSTQRSEELSPKTKKPETLDVNSVTLPSAATSKSDKTKSKMELFREQFVFKPREKTVVPTEVRKCSQASIFEDSSADVVDFDL